MPKSNNDPKAASGFSRWSNPRTSKRRQTQSASHSAGSQRRTSRRSMTPHIRRWVSSLVLLVIVCAVAIVGFTPLNSKITKGLDIQGGVSVIMNASKPDGSEPSSEDMAIATAIVQNRVNALGASEATVQQQGSHSILVQIPGATDAESAIKTIGQTGKLEFARLDQIGDADALLKLNNGAENVQLKEKTYKSFLDGSHIVKTAISQNTNSAKGGYSVNITFDEEGTKKFADVTKELAPIKGRIAIALDGKVKSAPVVQSVINKGEVSITGNFSVEEAKDLKTMLDSGSLPVKLTYSESRVVGPTLGQDSLNQGVVAIAIGACAVVVYLFLFYRALGFLTMGSLAVFSILYLGLLALLSHFGAFALTLPGLAGIVLTTGSAADSSILVLERFREEIRMGKSVKQAAISGSKHGIMTSLDADAVTMVTALALFFFAVGAVKGFGLTLALGIVCDIATMFFFKAPALRLLAQSVIEKHPYLWGVDQDLQQALVDKKKKLAATASAANGKTSHVAADTMPQPSPTKSTQTEGAHHA